MTDMRSEECQRRNEEADEAIESLRRELAQRRKPISRFLWFKWFYPEDINQERAEFEIRRRIIDGHRYGSSEEEIATEIARTTYEAAMAANLNTIDILKMLRRLWFLGLVILLVSIFR